MCLRIWAFRKMNTFVNSNENLGRCASLQHKKMDLRLITRANELKLELASNGKGSWCPRYTSLENTVRWIPFFCMYFHSIAVLNHKFQELEFICKCNYGNSAMLQFFLYELQLFCFIMYFLRISSLRFLSSLV